MKMHLGIHLYCFTNTEEALEEKYLLSIDKERHLLIKVVASVMSSSGQPITPHPVPLFPSDRRAIAGI